MNHLKLSMFCDESRPQQSHPMLRAKGAECKHLVPVVAHICRELSNGSEEDTHRSDLLTALADFGDLMDSSPMVPSAEVSSTATELMRSALQNADWLQQHALATGTPLWHIVFKHHFAEHLAGSFVYLNPKYGWCFKMEDYVGRISILAHS